jgi:hypothetical protein
MRSIRAAQFVAIVSLLALEACRSDDVVPDVFVDEAHCAREPDAAPFGMCDVPMVPDADATAAE